MTVIAAAAPALPPHRYRQEEITEAFGRLVVPDGESRALLERVHSSAQVAYRYLALPLEAYPALTGFGAANDAFLTAALDLGERAIRDALALAGVAPDEVDVVMSTTVTGVAAPSLDARLAPRLGLRPDVKRLPLFGLGCVAGAAGVARLHDHLAAHPDGVGVLLSVELCSLTVQRDDTSVANLVASGLFGDGAAAVVLLGAEAARRRGIGGPAVVATRSRLYPDSERVMGWDVGDGGFRIVLDRSVADVVRHYLGDDVREFLEPHDLKTGDVATWIAHPGGPKVLDAMAEALDIDPDRLSSTWRSLAATGNLSSASVLHVLAAWLHGGPRPEAGAPGMLLALGPGFCSELVLLRW